MFMLSKLPSTLTWVNTSLGGAGRFMFINKIYIHNQYRKSGIPALKLWTLQFLVKSSNKTHNKITTDDSWIN